MGDIIEDGLRRRIAELEAERDRLREALAVYRKYVDLDVAHISAEDQALLEAST